MPRLSLIQTNFTGGEWSPRLSGRIDIERYNSSAKAMQNCIVRVQGGAARRFGTRFVTNAKFDASRSQLVPFVFSRADTYMLEFSSGFLRFFRDGQPILVGGVPYEITTPYTGTMPLDIDYSQRSDTLYIAHEAVPIHILQRFSDTNWKLIPAPFSTEPFREQGIYPVSSVTLSAATVGMRTATATVPVFLASDVGRAIIFGPGVAVITAFTSATVVDVSITRAFDTVNLPSTEWNLDASPMTDLTPLDKGPVGKSTNLTLAIDGWRVDDVGKYVTANGGLLRIGSYVSPTVVVAIIIRELTSVTTVPSLAWTLESSVWSVRNGYPRTLTFHQQRLLAAGSMRYPQTVWFSTTGEPLDFTIGLADDNAFSYQVDSDENNEIVYLSSDRDVIILTYGSEFTIEGGVEKPITPTSIQVKHQGPYGATRVRPVQAGSETIFVQRAGLKLRGMSYRFENDRYAASDITVFADHLFRQGIEEIAHFQEPHQILAALRTDGAMLFGTFDREQGVIAWVPQYTDGAYESIAVLPSPTGDQLWTVVRRLINGVAKRYVERFEPSFVPTVVPAPGPNTFPPLTLPNDYGYTVDCGKEYTFALGSATVTDLAHLQGKTVSIISDGVRQPDAVVVAGSITLPRLGFRVLVGLNYLARIEMLTPEAGTGTGTAQGNTIRIFETTLRLIGTIGCRVNGQEIQFQAFGSTLLDQPPQPFTGNRRIEILGVDRGDAPLVIEQPYALPFELSHVIRKVTFND